MELKYTPTRCEGLMNYRSTRSTCLVEKPVCSKSSASFSLHTSLRRATHGIHPLPPSDTAAPSHLTRFNTQNVLWLYNASSYFSTDTNQSIIVVFTEQSKRSHSFRDKPSVGGLWKLGIRVREKKNETRIRFGQTAAMFNRDIMGSLSCFKEYKQGTMLFSSTLC